MADAYPEWQRLNEILTVLNTKGFEQLEAEEIIEFGKLYRRAASELSLQRMHEADPARLSYLNELVGKCYPFVYTAPRRPWPNVLRFFTADFPRAIRRHAGWILLATTLAIVAGLIGYFVTVHDRALADQVLPSDLLTSSDSVAQRHHIEANYGPRNWLPLLERAPNASLIITNNIRVSILSFAGGMTAGLLTLYLMIFNGLMLGIMAATLAQDNLRTALNFWAFAAPHGVIELTAIFISGGAGFLLAYAIINPGELPRRIALREAGKEAVILMLGVAAMLVVAGTIEAFFSPLNTVHEGVKFIVAGSEAVLLYSYFFFAGRKATEKKSSPFGEISTPLPPV